MTQPDRDPYSPVRPTTSRSGAPSRFDEAGQELHSEGGGTTVFLLIAVIVVLVLALLGGGAWLLFNRGGSSGSGQTQVPSSIGSSKQGAAAVGSLVVDLATVKTSEGNSVSAGAGDGARFVIISSRLQQPSAAGTTGGAYFALDPAESQALSGHTVAIRITARAAAANPTSRFALAFSGNGLGDSGWITFVPTADFETYALRVALPAAVGPSDYVAIWADVFGLGKALEVSKVEIVPLS